MEYVLLVIMFVKNVQEQLILVLNVFLEEMYHQIVTVHQDNMKKQIFLVKIVTGIVLNVQIVQIHVLLVEEIEN